MTTVELLESRIAELEKKVYGMENVQKGINDTESCVIDSLLHANTLVSSALSGREKANVAIKRLPELNNYLDPIFESTEIPTKGKLQLLLAMEQEINNNYKSLCQMQELLPVLEAERLRDVPELTNKLNNLNLTYLKVYKDSEDVNVHVNEVFSKYNEVITGISKALITLDAAVTAAEIAAMPKKQLD